MYSNWKVILKRLFSKSVLYANPVYVLGISSVVSVLLFDCCKWKI
jgi:hypothetical protein